MTIQEALEKLQGYEKATFALNHATGLMYYDGATIAPKGTTELRGSTLGELLYMNRLRRLQSVLLLHHIHQEYYQRFLQVYLPS